MSTTTTVKATYRKTQSGEWVAYGPVSYFLTSPSGATLKTATGNDVGVAKRDGTAKYERVARLGRPFDVAGVEMVYAYLAKSTPSYYTTPDCGHHHNVAGCDMCRLGIGL